MPETVKPYELLSLAFIPREEALKIADLSAQQCAAERIPPRREMWNYRCDRCLQNAAVYRDNNTCYWCEEGCRE